MTKSNGKTDSPNFIEKMVHDMGATASAALVILGHKLGLYGALAKDGPMSSEGLAGRTRTNERYVREWLAAQAAAGYVEYDTTTERFSMNDDQVAVFADAESPVFMAGGFSCLASLFIDEPKITKAFKTGEGVGWGEHSECLFCGSEEFFRPAYNAHLISEWITTLYGVNAKLHRGDRLLGIVAEKDSFASGQSVGLHDQRPWVALDVGVGGGFVLDAGKIRAGHLALFHHVEGESLAGLYLGGCLAGAENGYAQLI